MLWAIVAGLVVLVVSVLFGLVLVIEREMEKRRKD